MTSFPVIERELRVQARKRVTYYGRLLVGLAAILGLALLFWDNPQVFINGAPLFALLHGWMAGALLLLAPLWVADSISRERREGTLGLLFLTPLSARSIVLGKFAAHFCRLFYLWLMMIPFLLLPILLGGVSLEGFALSAAILLSILIIGTAASMVSSSVSAGFGGAIARALLFASLANHLISTLVTNIPFLALRHTSSSDVPLVIRLLFMGPVFVFIPEAALEAFKTIFASRTLAWSMAAGWIGGSVLVFLAALKFCVRKIARHAESSVETARQAAIRRRFFKPVLWKERFRRSMSRRLDRNPLSWLEYRSPLARASRWAAVLAVVGLQVCIIGDVPTLHGFFEYQMIVLCGLLLVITLKSASSFHYEKENGAFELILVTPTSPESLVSKRLLAVMQYFWPVTLTITLFALLALTMDAGKPIDSAGSAVAALSLWFGIFSVPAAGLYFALRCKTFFAALFLTVGVAICSLPLLWKAVFNLNGMVWEVFEFSAALMIHWAITEHWWPQLAITALSHCLIISFCRRGAMSILERRAFSY